MFQQEVILILPQRTIHMALMVKTELRYTHFKLRGLFVMGSKVDIIIPAYKAQNTIYRTLASIAIQSIRDEVRVTIVNDADGMDYAKEIQRFADLLDIREIKMDTNGGPGVARQYGIDNTNCPYFTCIDADDSFASPFALEILVKNMEAEPEYHTVIGGFLEEHPGLQFVNHQQDLVWMFGKLYKRAFIKRYDIRFNDTRANEDNGFNTTIRLVSSDTEKIKFIEDIVYYWHYKEDSITRINNAQYSYDQSFIGYTDNMIWAIQQARKRKPFNGYINIWAIQVMAQLYIYYLQTCKRDPRFKTQNYNYCVKYYKEVYKQLEAEIPPEHFADIAAQTIAQQASNMTDILPDQTIYQFIDDLKRSATNSKKANKEEANV